MLDCRCFENTLTLTLRWYARFILHQKQHLNTTAHHSTLLALSSQPHLQLTSSASLTSVSTIDLHIVICCPAHLFIFNAL